jgi:hypothetical protein
VYCGADSGLGVPAELRHLVSPFPEVRQRYPGLGASAGATVASGAAEGTAIGTAIPGIGNVAGGIIGTIAGVGQAIINAIGGGTPDAMKAIWSAVPASLLRISGGHGVWHDTLTGQTLSDAETDLRKSAIVASAINAFNDSKNWWYDLTSQQHLTGADAMARWNAAFNGASFGQAYSAYPNAFRTFGPTTAGDPQIHSPSAYPAPSAAYGASATPQQVIAAGQSGAIGTSGAPQQASVLGGLSSTALLVIVGGVAVGLLLSRRTPSRGS